MKLIFNEKSGKKIGIDFDGTLTRCNQRAIKTLEFLRLPWSIINLLFIYSSPNKEVVKALKKIQHQHQIMIISSRPRFLRGKIERFLERQGLNKVDIVCTGWLERKKRKLKILKETGIKVYIDNEKDIRTFLADNMIVTLSPVSFCRRIAKRASL